MARTSKSYGREQNLKRLDLGQCSSLIKTPNFTEIPNLEFLDLSNCASLSQIHQSIGVLKRLEELNLQNCTRLKSHPDFTGISNIRFLNLSNCASLSHVNSSILVLKQLQELDLGFCISLKSLPLDMTSLKSLEVLTLSMCKEIEKFPKIVGITSLKVLRWGHTLPEDFPPFSSLSNLYDLSFSGCSRLEEFPDLSVLKHVSWFHAHYTAITKLPSPNLLPKKFRAIQVIGHNHLPAESGQSCFNGCGLLEERSHPFRVSFLWFNYSPEVVYSYYISHGGKQINVERYFLEGLCVNYDSEHSGYVLYFGLGELDRTWSPFPKMISKDGRDIFDFLMIGASLATSGISEWFNNTTTTCSSVTLQDCLRYEEGRSTRRLEVVDTIDFTFPMDHSKLKDNRKLKGCSLFFVFEFHGPAWDSQSFHGVKDDGIPTEPLFLWAPEVPGVGPIEYWAFVPTRKREYCAYYFPSKERECEISLEEFEDLLVDVKDCRVRLVYEDDASQFYSTVAPHGLHSQYYEQSRGTARDEEMDSDEHLYSFSVLESDFIGTLVLLYNEWHYEQFDFYQHQLVKARDEIEAMRAAREKDLQEFAKKQAEMEATLRDHREEQRVEQERIRLEQEERMKREQERMRVEHEEHMQQEQERMRKEQERLRAEISKELEKKMSSVMEKKMSDMSKRLFSQFGGSKR
ncbi:Protein SUPPRESSOR OF npr1-1, CONSTITUTIVE 1 [Morella rubra]|uniref:Protein SUPPRESSOR OF npr1-1, CONSTITUTIVE 1 n=1 Tax=Morella rubra TaxID=262757 RepID=A0A6A1WSY5_9ROSI|nr:Protein SUPPRESSOR OF npr1-1, CONSTITUTIVE 1 [Morella rubra]